MEYSRLQFSAVVFWELVRRQHGVIAHRQLLELGMHPQAVKRRLAGGRLHRLWRGVYAVGRPEVSQEGRWMAAILACGDGAALGGESAATLAQMGGRERGVIEVIMPPGVPRALTGIRVRRADILPAHLGTIQDIPLTSPARTLVDLARTRSRERLETAINEADKRGLIDTESLRGSLEDFAGVHGVAALRRVLDRRTFVLTESALERLFLPVARSAGLPKPLTQQEVNGHRVDFFWPAIGLVVETDGLRYHRTPAQQAKDHVRTQAHFASGLWPLRFTHEQVRYERDYVERTLRNTLRRIEVSGTATST